MSRRTLLILALSACCALMLACAGADNANTTNTANASNANRAATTTNAASTPAATTTPAASTASTGDKIGVAECDDYLTKVDTCVTSKVPAAAHAQYTASIDATRKQWRDLAANPQTRAGLVSACKQAVESARAAYKSYGCEF